jgi:hypothetical protein
MHPRRHTVFYGLTDDALILDSFQVSPAELPVVYLIAEDGDGLVPFTGEILELGLSEWVLRCAT